VTKRVLVTGGTGFIGARLVERLVAAERSVRCLVRATSNTEHLESLGVECFVGDLREEASLRAACEGVSEVYHLAALLKAPWHKEFTSVTAEGCGRMAAACAAQPEPPVLILVSSLAAAGPSASGRDEVQPAEPISRYGRAKLAGEEAARPYADRVPLTVIRPPLVLGEGDRSLLPVFRMARCGWVVAPGRAPLSMIHVDDLVQSLMAAAEKGERVAPAGSEGKPDQGVYFVADGEARQLTELGAEIARSLGKSPPRTIRMPLSLLYAAAAASEAWGRLRDRQTLLNLDKIKEAGAEGWVCSSDKAREQLGFEPAPFEERLRATGAWYQAQGWLS
jgi:nucleoside-diphosphate-sugar epimerase